MSLQQILRSAIDHDETQRVQDIQRAEISHIFRAQTLRRQTLDRLSDLLKFDIRDLPAQGTTIHLRDTPNVLHVTIPNAKPPFYDPERFITLTNRERKLYVARPETVVFELHDANPQVKPKTLSFTPKEDDAWNIRQCENRYFGLGNRNVTTKIPQTAQGMAAKWLKNAKVAKLIIG